ncbi:hypothetical protein RFI_25582 [Reticulomyxa filosa]|uniref:Caspase family p20 domain-containing protein n=1 Tax=Reticulomyxa filosa TaxID=46433 RepID=X6MD24_RETFI|nr:hypothetical protein RFI_25582 [Reticulomyxa filosa]|eukprot:ETO11794.1 hypothetical protein RFI_25582 [Reticulomyxa filosa]
MSINTIRQHFDCHKRESLKDCPKIFIIDICRGERAPKAYEVPTRGSIQEQVTYGHNDDGFLLIWSTTSGHKVIDLSLLSKSMKKVISAMYKNGYSLHQMLKEIRDDIRKSKSGEWYCIESQDTTAYDIIFAPRKSQ